MADTMYFPQVCFALPCWRTGPSREAHTFHKPGWHYSWFDCKQGSPSVAHGPLLQPGVYWPHSGSISPWLYQGRIECIWQLVSSWLYQGIMLPLAYQYAPLLQHQSCNYARIFWTDLAIWQYVWTEVFIAATMPDTGSILYDVEEPGFVPPVMWPHPLPV